MNQSQKTALTASLTAHIGKWFEQDSANEIRDEIAGYVGYEIERTMAEAAMAVLEANYKLFDYLSDSHLLDE